MKIQSVNPATERVNKEFDTITADDALETCKRAKAASSDWRDLGIEKRTEIIRRFGSILRSKNKEFARLMSIEMGRVFKDALIEVESCAKICDFFASNSKQWLQDEIIKTEYKKSVIAFEPLGVVLAIMPWNFPFSQVIRCAAPALTMGNAMVLKHSNTVPMCAMAIQEAFREAGAPEHVFNAIIVDHSVAPKLIKSRYIDAVSFTGSIDSGRGIAKLAASSIKKCVLELGGSNAFLVLSDADVDLAARKAVETRIASTGQSCSSSKRFIVVPEVADEFTKKVIDITKALVIGDPLDEKTQIGPLANMQQLQKLDSQVKDAVSKGAKLECGGGRLGSKGFFYKPTVLTGVKKNMVVMKEEVFGPVIPIIRVRNEKEAIRLANDTDYGLGSSIWTRDTERGEKIARQMESGMACVNRGASSDMRLPFGGVKKSGIGREFSHYALLEFANMKSIIVG